LDVNNNPLGKWTPKANFPGVVRYGAVAFAIGSKGYLGFGYDGVFLKDFYEYDPSIDSWAIKPTYTGKDVYLTVSFSIEDKGYVVAGTNGTTPVKDFWIFSQ
jgi:N-acetylneuraminic acid mutarotase